MPPSFSQSLGLYSLQSQILFNLAELSFKILDPCSHVNYGLACQSVNSRFGRVWQAFVYYHVTSCPVVILLLFSWLDYLGPLLIVGT